MFLQPIWDLDLDLRPKDLDMYFTISESVNLDLDSDLEKEILNCAARAVSKTRRFHHITHILESFYSLKINERIKYPTRFSFSLKTGQPTCLQSLVSFITHRSLGLLLLSPLVALLSPLILKLRTDRFSFRSCFVEQSHVRSTSRCSSRHSFTYIKLACL